MLALFTFYAVASCGKDKCALIHSQHNKVYRRKMFIVLVPVELFCEDVNVVDLGALLLLAVPDAFRHQLDLAVAKVPWPEAKVAHVLVERIVLQQIKTKPITAPWSVSII